MPKLIYTGPPGPVRQPTEISYDPQRGMSVIERWESVGDGLVHVATHLQALRIGYSFTRSGHKSVLVTNPSSGTTPSIYPEVTTDSWQVLGNELQKSVQESPAWMTIDATTRKRLNAALDAKTDPSAITPAFSEPAKSIYALLFNGQNHYATSQYVIRHTTNV